MKSTSFICDHLIRELKLYDAGNVLDEGNAKQDLS